MQKPLNELSIPEAALRYASRGWRVLPLDGKIPLIKEWQKRASTDPEQIHAWWHEYPEANIGIATGEESGIWVLDIDGEAGEASLIDHQTTFGNLPATYEVETGKGRHLYWIQSNGVRIKNQASGSLGLKLDVRGDGGYVVAPPSIHPESKKKYMVSEISLNIPAIAPPWLFNLVTITRESKRQELNDGFIPEKIPQGKRNVILTRVAGQLRRIGSNAEEILAALVKYNVRCSKPMTEAELVTIAKSISRYEPGRIHANGAVNDAEFVVKTADEDKDEPISWRWPQFLPRAMLVGWGGDPGQGKSTMAYYVAAAISRGSKLPGDDGPEEYEPESVIILSAEDDRKKTIKPRLRLMNANMEKIYLVSSLASNGAPIGFPEHLTQLNELVRETKAKLVVIDPLDTFLSEDVDSHKNADVRRAIMPLVNIAENTGAIMLMLGHLNKSSQSSAMYRMGGSIAFTAAPRAVFVFAYSEDEDKNHHVMSCLKTNVSRMPESLMYELENVHVEGIGPVSRIKWLGKVQETAETTLAASNGNGFHGGRKRSAGILADKFIQEALAAGPMPSAELDKLCEKKNVCSLRTLAMTKREMCISKCYFVNRVRVWYTALNTFDWSNWELPVDNKTDEFPGREPGEDEE